MSKTDGMNNFEQKLVSGLYRFDCPDPFILGDFHFGLVSEASKKEIEDHLKVCPLCRNELDDLKEFLKGEITTGKTTIEETQKIKKIIPFARNEVMYVSSEPEAAVRSSGSTAMENKKVRIKYSDLTYVDLFYNIVREDLFYIFKGQFAVDETMEKKIIDSLIEIWQDNKIVTAAKIDSLCTFRCVIKELDPVLIRISNQTGNVLSFQLNVTK